MPGMSNFVERYDAEQLAILKPFFTNTDSNVFVLRNTLPQTTKAAFFARYSRSPMSLRTLFLKEFVTDPDTGEYYDGIFDYIKAVEKASEFKVGGPRSDSFFKRVLSEYGDDSVIDSASAHIAIEGVDQVEAKAVEDGRLAGYIEKSTRYVDFTNRYGVDNEGFITGPKSDGLYLYKAYPAVLGSSIGNEYTYVNDLLFGRVKEMQPQVASRLMRIYPLENFPFSVNIAGKTLEVRFSEIEHLNGVDVENEKKKAERAYRTSIKAASLDVVRVLLPTSTMTNLGWFASYRSLDHSLIKMLSSAYPPSVETANKCYEELMKEDEPLIRRVMEGHGVEEQKFLRFRENELIELAKNAEVAIGPNKSAEGASVKLLHYEDEDSARARIAAATIYPYTNAPMESIIRMLRENDKIGAALNSDNIIKAAASGRENRRHKPPRSFELTNYDAEFIGDIGVFRDLQRNRFTLQIRQKFGISEGYVIPDIIRNMGFEDKFVDAIEAAESLYKDAVKITPQYAEACVTFAHKVRWIASADLRQYVWWIELRTGRQGHPSYRKLMQSMYSEMNKAHPGLVNNQTVPFADMNDYPLGRLAASYSTENKLEKLRR